jgi:hypothetical protein
MRTVHPYHRRMSFPPFRGPQKRAQPSFTDDRAHAHFLQPDHRFPVTRMEIRLESALGLNDRYRHIIQALHTALQHDEAVSILYHTPRGPFAIYGTMPDTGIRKLTAGMVDVYWHDELMLSFYAYTPPPAGITAHEAMEFLMPYLAALRILRACNGFMVIDHTQLLRYQSYQWTVYDTGNNVGLYQSPPRAYEEMIEDACLIHSSRSFHCRLADVGRWQIVVKDYVLCDNILTKTHAKEIIRQLSEIRKNKGESGFDLNIITGIESIPFPSHTFPQKLTVFFPSWVAALNNTAYRQHIRNQVRNMAPDQTACVVEFVGMEEMETLLPAYREWLEDVRLTHQLGSQDFLDNTAAFQVLKMILDRQPAAT